MHIEKQISDLTTGRMTVEDFDRTVSDQLRKERELQEKKQREEEEKKKKEQEERIRKEHAKKLCFHMILRLTVSRRVDEILAKHERREARRARRQQLEEQQAKEGTVKNKGAMPTPYDKWAEFSVCVDPLAYIHGIIFLQDSDDSDEELIRQAKEQPNPEAQAFLGQIEKDAAERAARRKAREAEGESLKNRVLVYVVMLF